MSIWTAKKFKLPNMNFEATAIRFDDGRVGLCYHGRTIWQEKDGGWDESVGRDWQEVWKYGRLCAYDELPEDMRLTCPKCGHKIGRDDSECLYCGIILSKAAVDAGKTASAEEAPLAEESAKGRSRMVDAVLIILVLIITAGILYNLTRPKIAEHPPQADSAPVVRTTAPEQPRSGSNYDYSRKETVDPEDKLGTAEIPDPPTESASPETPEPVVSTGEVSSSNFYGHINLNNQAEAHAALQTETKKLQEERRQLAQAQKEAMTMTENQILREKMLRYNTKNAALQQLITAYKERYENQ